MDKYRPKSAEEMREMYGHELIEWALNLQRLLEQARNLATARIEAPAWVGPGGRETQ